AGEDGDDFDDIAVGPVRARASATVSRRVVRSAIAPADGRRSGPRHAAPDDGDDLYDELYEVTRSSSHGRRHRTAESWLSDPLEDAFEETPVDTRPVEGA